MLDRKNVLFRRAFQAVKKLHENFTRYGYTIITLCARKVETLIDEFRVI